jgi:hypothetical protein
MTLTRATRALLALLALGCVPMTAFDKLPQRSMSPRLAYRGFSFDRPTSPSWYLLQSEQEFTHVTLRRDGLAGEAHSFYALVSLGAIDRQPASHEEFAELARVDQEAPYTVRTVAYEQKLVTRQNQWCMRFDSTHAVLGAPPAPDRELTMVMHGYRCLHPTWEKVTLDFFYSERGVANDLDPALAAEGETFLEGVRIDVAPDTPAS